MEIFGTTGPDDLQGTESSDIIHGDLGNDTEHGKGGDDTLNGDAGDDTLYGEAGNDTLNGSDGNDILDGGTGADAMNGGLGNDTYYIDNVGDTVSEVLSGGIDTVMTTIAYSLAGLYVENATLTGTAGLTLTGNSLDNILTGNSGNNTLNGGDGNDTLNGGTGADTMVGGLGDDTYYVDNASDVITEVSSGGTDTVISSITFDMSGKYVENATLSGTAALSLTGNSFDNVLTGNSGVNTINGGDGNDTIDGGGGADTLIGGLGNDTYIINNAGVAITEVASGGTDTVISSITYDMTGKYVENGTLSGTTAINLTGNSFDNMLTGNSGINTLNGGDGNDTLDGGGGADTLIGGLGNDTYIINNAGVTISEVLAGGTDTVISSITYDLTGINVENAMLSGTSGLNLTGNSFDNMLTGNSGNNTLNGGDGNDTLDGGAGVDTLIGGLGNDTYFVDNAGDVVTEVASGGVDIVYSTVTYTLTNIYVENATLLGTNNLDLSGNTLDNVLTGNSGINTLNGNDGNDTLDGGGGADTLIGGLGNDTYLINNTGVTISEVQAGGTDTVISSITYDLTGINVENATLVGTADLNLTGNLLDNVLTGNAGNNTFFGGGGADTMIGGAGNDIYNVDNVNDVVIESAGNGIDTIVSSVSYSLAGQYVDILTLTGTGNLNATGNTLDNTLIGNSGNNLLSGGSGNDTLNGGLGADVLDGGAGTDTASYTTAAAGITVFLGGPQLNAGEAQGDTYVSIENIAGTSFADILGGDNGNNLIIGNDGNDWLLGSGGTDTLQGGNGNDVLEGGAGADVLDGGLGTDVASYRNSTAGITIDALDSTAGAGDGAGDTLINVENIWGSAFNDVIKGDNIGGQVYGFEGNDVLDGRAGNDVFYGGTGADTITTGTGFDDIFYLSYSNHTNQYGTVEPYEGGDTITDFTHGADHITVSRYWFGFGNIAGPAAALTSAYADFITSGTTAVSSKPTFFWNDVTKVLQFDPDGTGASAAVILATLTGATLTLNDIWTA